MKKILMILSLCFSLSAFADCPCENNAAPAPMEAPVAQDAPAANETDNSGKQESAAVEQETKTEVQS